MNKHALATTYEFEFYDGTKTQMTLSFARLKMLSSKNKSLYERYMKIMSTEKGHTEFDMLAVLYAAYVCAHLDEDVMTEDEFIEMCGTDRYAIRDAMNAMTNPKKR